MAPKRPKIQYGSFDVIAAFVFGIVAAIPLGMLGYFYLIGEIESSLRIVILAALGACIGALLCIVFIRVILKKLTGTEAPSVSTVLEHVESAVGSLSSGRSIEGGTHVLSAIKDSAAILAWVNGRRWIGSIFLGAIGLFAGAATTYFLVQQNAILNAQNELFGRQEQILVAQKTITRNQMLTQESQRYLPLNSELNAVLTAIQEEGSEREGRPDYMLKMLSEQTARKIEALTLAYRPYWYIDSFSPDIRNITSKANALPAMVYLSPERGLILRAILQNRVAMDELTTADFSFADMRGIRVEGTKYGDWTASDDAWGHCELMMDYATMHAGVAQDASNFETELIERLMRESGIAQVSLPAIIPGLQNASIDFSHSYLSGIYLDGQVKTFRFSGATLINVEVSAASALDLEGAEVRSIMISRQTGSVPVEINARGATFYGQICADELEFEVEKGVDPIVQKQILAAAPDGFAGARISEWLVDEGFFAFANLELSTAKKIDSEYQRMDWQLYAFPSLNQTEAASDVDDY